MYCISDWYTSFANLTFPTVFIRLKPDEIESIISNQSSGKLITKIERVIQNLPGKSFVHADCCAPTDSANFIKRNGAINSAILGWEILLESAKVVQAFKDKRTERIGFHPYRRMSKVREFRIFVKDRQCIAMSQRYLNKHYAKIEARKKMIWDKGKLLIRDISSFLPADNLVVDVYLNSANQFMILDLNTWGSPTEPLLLRDWNCDWHENMGLKLVEKPVQLKGEVSVSF